MMAASRFQGFPKHQKMISVWTICIALSIGHPTGRGIVNFWDGYAMFLMGFLGTGHCLGMCGPLVFAFPGQVGGMKAHGAYHVGRILTYTLVGLVMGGIGGAVVLLAGRTQTNPVGWMAGIQSGLALVAGVFMLGFGLTRIGLIPEPDWMAAATPTCIPGARHFLRRSDQARPEWRLFATGLIMGLLPCGLSFAAFARALATAEPLAGAGLEPDAIGYINLHGTASKANDAVENVAIGRRFGGATRISSTKGWTGHALGAAGILEAVIALDALAGQRIPGTLNTTEVDPGFAFPVQLDNMEAPLRFVMSNSFGFGGNNATLVFGRNDD